MTNAKLHIVDAEVKLRMIGHMMAWKDCTLCKIGEHARNHVFIRGTLPADVLFIGEAPGLTEDVTGWPFVGKAGRELNSWISEIGLEQVVDNIKEETDYDKEPYCFSFAVTNLTCCRPAEAVTSANRSPTKEEIFNCSHRLRETIAICQPRAIVLLGRTAAESVGVNEILGLSYVPTRLELLHPSAVMRSPEGRVQQGKRESQIKKLYDFLKENEIGVRN